MVRASVLFQVLLTIAVSALSVGMPSGVAKADEVAMPQTSMSSAPASLPRRGETMSSVVRQFGQPATKHPAAGGDSPRHPPITRWDYPAFSVFFEQSHVVDAVIPGQPPSMHNTDQLQPAAN